jgi:hypothetical protein
VSIFRFYLYRQEVLFPNVVQAEEGFFIDEAPVTVFGADAADDIRSFLEGLFAAGNTTVPTPDSAEAPGSVLLELLHLKKWSAFEKEAVMFTILETGESIECWYTGRGTDGMWRRDPERRLIYPAAERAQAIEEVIRVLATLKSGDPPQRPGGLMLRPPDPA